MLLVLGMVFGIPLLILAFDMIGLVPHSPLRRDRAQQRTDRGTAQATDGPKATVETPGAPLPGEAA